MDDGINMGLLIAMIEQASGADPEQIEQFVQNWLDAHPEATTTVQDGSITLAKLASDLAAKINSISSLSDEIVDLKSAISDIAYKKSGMPEDEIPTNTWTSGIWLNKSVIQNTGYAYSSEIQVYTGQIVTLKRNSANTEMRFIEGYNANGDIVPAASVSTDTTEYVVPDNVVALRVTTYSGYVNEKVLHVQTPTQYYTVKKESEKMAYSTEISSASAAQKYILIGSVDNKKNCEYSFFGKFDSFTALEIGHGKTEYGAVYLVVDNEHITTYAYNGTQYQQFTHGLTFSDFISVSIKVADSTTARATVTIQTKKTASDNDEYYTVSNAIFFGCAGDVYFNSTLAMTDVKFVYTIMDLKKDVFVFGDSYISLSDDMKWPHYAISANDNNMLLSGFGGATSANELLSLKNILPMRTPRYLCWLLGMNDPDNGAINTSWKNCIDEVMQICDDNKIELILATIPNTPTMNNTYKNAYVKQKAQDGYRYIDFANAVGAESEGSSWYAGMLSSDNVHPAALGAKALWLRMILDCPEIIN